MKTVKLEITGGAGTGKTTLLDQLTKYLRRKGYTVDRYSPLNNPHTITIKIPWNKETSK